MCVCAQRVRERLLRHSKMLILFVVHYWLILSFRRRPPDVRGTG